MKPVEWGKFFPRLVQFFAGTFVKTGEVRTKGRVLALYEGSGKKALVARKVIFRKGKPLMQIVTGWKQV